MCQSTPQVHRILSLRESCLATVPALERVDHLQRPQPFARARNHWAEDKTHSFRRFELTDEFGTDDRCPPKPYVRESIRIKAMYMMREQDKRHFEGGRRDDAGGVHQ